MALVSPADQQRLRDTFAVMTRKVHLIFFTQTLDCEACPLTRQVLDELPVLSDKIVIDEVNLVLDAALAKQYGVDRVPSIALTYEDDASEQRDTRMRFVGTPAGYEFISLVQAVLLAGGRPSTLQDGTKSRLAAASTPLTIQVFTTPT